MIKGYRKNMIAVNGGDGDIFETAYFILKDGHSGEEISENDMLIEAEKIIEKNLLNGEASKNSDKKKKSSEKTGSKAIIPFAAGATVGSAIGLLWLFL